MRRPVTSSLCLLLAGSVGVLAACSSGGNADRPAPTRAPVSKQAGVEAAVDPVTAGLGFVAQNLLAGIASYGGTQTAGFLMAALAGPDQTTQSLTAIKSQLTTITTRLDEVEAGIKQVQTELATLQQDTTMATLSNYNVDVTTIYRNRFLPVMDAALELEQAKAGGGDTTAAEAKLKQKKADFKKFFISARVDSIMGKQHLLLMPDSQFPSALRATGKVMMTKGYVSSLDSRTLRRLYVALADQEALSARLTLEYDLMENDQEAYDRDARTYKDYVAAEVANLPPMIPNGQLVDTQRGSTTNTQIYMAPASNSRGDTIPTTPWLPVTPGGTQLGPDNVTPVLKANPGWELPTQAQMTSLFNATRNVPTRAGAASANTYTGSQRLTFMWWMEGKPGVTYDEITQGDANGGRWGQQWVWTKDTSASNPMSCWTGDINGANLLDDRVYTLHRVAYMGQKDSIALQAQPGRIPDGLNDPYSNDPSNPGVCDSYLNYLYNNATYAAGFILTQPSTADYMAQSTLAQG